MSIQCYLTLYNTHHPAEKLGLPDKSPEPHAIIKPIMAWASTLIEQLLMILIALGLLGFLLSMYLPLFRMAERF